MHMGPEQAVTFERTVLYKYKFILDLQYQWQTCLGIFAQP